MGSIRPRQEARRPPASRRGLPKRVVFELAAGELCPDDGYGRALERRRGFCPYLTWPAPSAVLVLHEGEGDLPRLRRTPVRRRCGASSCARVLPERLGVRGGRAGAVVLALALRQRAESQPPHPRAGARRRPFERGPVRAAGLPCHRGAHRSRHRRGHGRSTPAGATPELEFADGPSQLRLASRALDWRYRLGVNGSCFHGGTSLAAIDIPILRVDDLLHGT